MKHNPFYPVLILLMLSAFQLRAQQLKLLNLLQPYAVATTGANQNIIVEFENSGTVAVTSAQFTCDINGVGGSTVTWNGLLAPGNKTSFNIGNITIVSGVNDIVASVWDINGTGNNYADTVLFKVQSPGVQTIPYMDDLEGAVNFGASSYSWLYNPNGWQLAVPNYGSITPAPTGATAWVLGLDSGYGNNINTYLYSPIFNFAASGINSIYFHFVANANLAANDNLTVEYTTDLLTWTQLPAAVTVTGNTGGWAGFGTGLSFLANEPQVQLRFVFNSDGSGTSDGIAIDDIEVLQCVISVIDLNELTPVSCAWACDGVLEAVPQVGYPPFTYEWSTGETTQTISNVCAGNYFVTVTDVNGCTGQTGQTVNQPTPIIMNLGPDVSICQGSSALLCPNPGGGIPPYNYLWNTGAITSCIMPAVSGTFAVTVTDANGCAATDAISITIVPSPTPVINGNNNICNGQNTVFDAGSGYSLYQWSNGTITQLNTVSVSGTYTVTVTDLNGCTGSASINLSVSNPTPVITGNNIVCDGASTLLDAGAGYASYIWSTGNTSQTQLTSAGGGTTYTVTVTDLSGCTGSASFTYTQLTPVIVTPQNFYDCLTFVDSAYIDVSGSSGPPYIYNWSTGNTTNFMTNASPGVYTVNVTDVNGCTGSASFTIYGALHLLLNKTDPECFGYPGTIAADFNGIPPLTYQWSNAGTTAQLSNVYSGTYTVTVTDANNCSLTVTDSLIDPEPVVLILDSVVATGCGASSGAFYYSFTPAGFSIPWVNGVQFGFTQNITAGVYSIYIVQNVCASNTVTVVVPDSCADVWPGDANYDLVADNKDLLQIGLAYGNTGPVRPSASNVWVAQSCTDWSNWFNIGVNQKHADCDGNGLIEAADTIPILLNYGLTHPLKPIIIPQVNTLAPDLYLTITQDTTGLSDSVLISVMCGTASDPVDSIYGLAFTLYYDSDLVDTGSVFFDYSNTFLGTPGVNVISINKNFGVGYADFAITRTDHSNASGYGPVAVMGIVTTDNVAGKMLNPVNTTLQFSLGNVYAVTANEFPITLDAFGDSIFLDSNLTGINYLNWDAAVKVYPNPTSNYFTVASSLASISKISILNQLGEIVYNNQRPRLPQSINVATIPSGVYVLRIETNDGVMHRKIQIIR